MPELPEVETTRLGISPHIQGQTIQEVIVREPRLRWPVPANLKDLLVNLKVDSVERRGKYLLFATSKGTVIVHLGMSGSLRILPADKAALKHDHVDFVFNNGTLLRFNDPRRFGTILWTTDPVEQYHLLKDLGVEPLLTIFTGHYLYQKSRRKSTTVKSFLMDSHVVVGVGNIYANEALYMAGIHPQRQAGKISQARYEALVSAVKEVLQNAIRQGGTTLRNFVNEAGNPGYFKQQLYVYGRADMPCKNCLTLLKEIRINNRTTVFCPHCQK